MNAEEFVTVYYNNAAYRPISSRKFIFSPEEIRGEIGSARLNKSSPCQPKSTLAIKSKK